MAVTARINNKMLLLKPFSISGLGRISSVARSGKGKSGEMEAEVTVEKGRRSMGDGGGECWMPHPRTGIYFPRGQERVMDDIPIGAASLDCTFWLRGGVDGVDHHKQDHHHFH